MVQHRPPRAIAATLQLHPLNHGAPRSLSRGRADAQRCQAHRAGSPLARRFNLKLSYHAGLGVACDRAVQRVGAGALGHKHPLGGGPRL